MEPDGSDLLGKTASQEELELIEICGELPAAEESLCVGPQRDENLDDINSAWSPSYDVYNDLSHPFDIGRAKITPMDCLKRWRQAALCLNASRRFRYTIDAINVEEKQRTLEKVRAHNRVIKASLVIVGAQPSDAAISLPTHSLPDESIAGMSTDDLHARLNDKSLDASSRDSIMGELAIRKMIFRKGKGTVTCGGYVPGKSPKSSSSVSPTTISARSPGSKPDHVAVEGDPLVMTTIAYRCQSASSSASMDTSNQNDYMHGTMITTSRGSPEYTTQRCPPPIINEQALQGTGEQYDSNYNNYGRASGVESSPESTAHDHRSGAYAFTGADVEAGDNNSGQASGVELSSESNVHDHQSGAYAVTGADVEAGGNNSGQPSRVESSSESTAHDHQSGVYAVAGADVEAGGCRCTTCCEPLPEPIAMLREPPAVILVAGAFTLLSGNPDTFRRPLERVLLGVMIVGFLSSFAWLLMGSRRRMRKASFFLRWTAVWAVFMTFFLIMIILIAH